jgi:hypothetical protein
MAFNLNRKRNEKKAVVDTPLWRVDHIVGNEFVTLVLDIPLHPDTDKADGDILIYLERMLQ